MRISSRRSCFFGWFYYSRDVYLIGIVSMKARPIILIWLILSVMGLLAIYSVSIHESFMTTLKFVWKSGRTEPTNYFYFSRQVFYFGLGLFLGWIVYKLPLRILQQERVVIIIGVGSLIMQLLVFTPLGIDLNGATGRLDLRKIGINTTIQPVEFFKFGYVIFLAWWLIRKRSFVNTREFFISFAVLNAVLFLVLLLIPDMGSVLVLGLVALVMCRYAGARLRYIVSMMALGLIVGIVIGLQFGYVRQRFYNFINPNPNDRQAWRQTQQALIAIGWWWIIGQWYGKGLQKFWYLPEAQSDFIFAAFSEEIGFVGNIILISLYAVLAYYVLTQLSYVKDPYMRVLGVGLISIIIIQMFVNIGVNIRILPATWLTLPFISSWGTALIVNMMQVVLLYKIVSEWSTLKQRKKDSLMSKRGRGVLVMG